MIATVSTEAKAAIARDAGADEVILYSQKDFEVETKRVMGGKGVDVVYDSVGKDTSSRVLMFYAPSGYDGSFRCIEWCGAAARPDYALAKGSLYLTRPSRSRQLSLTTEDLQERRARSVQDQ